jgi:hypothetical protein
MKKIYNIKRELFLLITFLLSGTYNILLSQNSIAFNGGIAGDKSYGVLIAYNYNDNNSNYEVGINYSVFKDFHFKDEIVEFDNTLLQLGYFHTIYRSRSNSINFNIGLGALAGYETIKEKENIVIKSKNGFVAGGYGGCQLDFFITDNFGFNIRYQQNYFAKTTTGSTNPFASAGLKFNF